MNSFASIKNNYSISETSASTPSIILPNVFFKHFFVKSVGYCMFVCTYFISKLSSCYFCMIHDF